MTVALEPPLVQVRTLADLPPVRPADLATLVAAQASRYFRKNGGALVTDAVWVRRDGGSDKQQNEPDDWTRSVPQFGPMRHRGSDDCCPPEFMVSLR